MESVVRFRRVYIRLIAKGKVLENSKTITEYVDESFKGAGGNSPTNQSQSAPENTQPDGYPNPIKCVYILKNVQQGQREIPLLPTNRQGAALPGYQMVVPSGTGAQAGPRSPTAPGGGALAGGPTGSNPLMQMIMQMQQARAAGGGGPGGPGANPFLAGLGGGGAAGMPQIPPRERFRTQLEQLRTMGFEDEEQCIRVLTQVNGNVEAAIGRLFGE